MLSPVRAKYNSDVKDLNTGGAGSSQGNDERRNDGGKENMKTVISIEEKPECRMEGVKRTLTSAHIPTTSKEARIDSAQQEDGTLDRRTQGDQTETTLHSRRLPAPHPTSLPYPASSHQDVPPSLPTNVARQTTSNTSNNSGDASPNESPSKQAKDDILSATDTDMGTGVGTGRDTSTTATACTTTSERTTAPNASPSPNVPEPDRGFYYRLYGPNPLNRTRRK